MYKDDWYEDPIDTGDWVRVNDLPDLEAVKDWLQGMAEAMYQTGDTNALERSFEEVCCHMGVQYKYEDLKLQKKGIHSNLDWLEGYAQAYEEVLNAKEAENV